MVVVPDMFMDFGSGEDGMARRFVDLSRYLENNSLADSTRIDQINEVSNICNAFALWATKPETHAS
ncbi:hypothetical protein [Streptomyces sp. 1222.5]|uniref:hypothetical protein n=1 Tax=Streptomyces sp. 1222.5 TaxID=1881026 RepID=UPI003D75352A